MSEPRLKKPNEDPKRLSTISDLRWSVPVPNNPWGQLDMRLDNNDARVYFEKDHRVWVSWTVTWVNLV